MSVYDKVSILIASISLIINFISIPMIFLQIKQLKRANPIIKCKIDYESSAFIEPIYTNLGNECSILLSITLLNSSSTSIEITDLNIEFHDNTWSCLTDSTVIDQDFKFSSLDCTETINPKYRPISRSVIKTVMSLHMSFAEKQVPTIIPNFRSRLSIWVG